jgi:hypothetical protein
MFGSLLVNSSFELGSPVPASWAYTSNTWSFDTTVKYSGSRSAKCANSDTFDHYIEQTAFVDPGTVYEFSQYVKNEVLSSALNTIRWVWWKSSAMEWPGGYLSEGEGGAVGPAASDWTFVQAHATSPDNANYMTYRCNQSNINGTNWFDCVRARRLPTVKFVPAASKLKIISSPISAAVNKPSRGLSFFPLLRQAACSLLTAQTGQIQRQ